MGSGYGWRCDNCGFEEQYFTGCGMKSFNIKETRTRIADGDFGAIAKHLLSVECPLDVDTVDQREYYRCSTCGKLVEGMSVNFSAGGHFDLVLHVSPDECPECGERFCLTEDRIPVSDGDIEAYIRSVLEDGCPACGSKETEPIFVMWD